MSRPATPTDTEDEDATSDDSEPTLDREELAARVDLLEEENSRLRREYARARQSSYRRTAIGLAVVGTLAVGAGLLFPGSREVLFALGAIGLFGAVLTYYLTPERFVAADVGERVYAALADNEADVVADLGLTDERVYVPTDDADGVRLFVPQHEEYTVPDADALDRPFVVTDGDERGLSVRPTGAALFEEFERSLAGPLADEPEPLAEQLADGVVEQFELADTVRVDSEGDRVSAGVAGSVYGPVDRFDHPVASLLAVGLATGLDEHVTMDVSAGDERFDHVVTVRWSE